MSVVTQCSGLESLTASHIELSSTRRLRCVQGNDFSAQKIVSSGKIGGDLDVELAAAFVQILDAPVVVVGGALVGWCPTVLIDC